MKPTARSIVNALDEVAGAAPKSSLLAVRIDLLDLSSLKAKLGTRWERSERTIHLLVEACIRKSIGPGDRWERSDDDQYLLLLSHASEESARTLCQAIMVDLDLKLLGSGEFHGSLSFGMNLLKLGSAALVGTPAERLAAIKAGRSLHALHSDQFLGGQLPPIPSEHPAPMAAPKVELTVIENADIDALVHLADKETRSWQSEQVAEIQMLSARRPDQSNPSPAKSGASATARSVDAIDYSFSYTPIWDLSKRALLCYRINFVVHMPTGQLIDAASPDFVAQLDRSTVKAIDMLRMKRALGDLMRSHRRGSKYLVSIPVSTHCCSPRWGVPTVFDHFTGLPKDLAKLVILDLIDGGRPEYRPAIGEITTAATRFGRQSLIRVDPNYESGLLIGSSARPVGVGIDAGDYDIDERELMKFLDRVAAEATAKDASVFLWGADTRSIALMAVAAGVNYVAGGAVATQVPDPAGVSMLALSDIFA